VAKPAEMTGANARIIIFVDFRQKIGVVLKNRCNDPFFTLHTFVSTGNLGKNAFFAIFSGENLLKHDICPRYCENIPFGVDIDKIYLSNNKHFDTFLTNFIHLFLI
jgi:hypothetical protein